MTNRRLIGPLTLIVAAATVAALTFVVVTRPGSGSMLSAAATPARAMDVYLSRLFGLHKFHGAVTVTQGTEVLLDKGYGLANAQTRMPLTPHTRLRIGSMTKQFTAASILILQELGKLNTTDRVCRYVPDCPAAWAPMTIEQLLTHTAGAPRYDSIHYAGLDHPTLTPEQLIGTFRGSETTSVPGTQFEYVDTGFLLLGYIIERITGGSYADFLAQHVFGPLGMAESGYDVNRPDPATHAVGYWNWDYLPVVALEMSIPYAAGALYSSTSDLNRWNRFLLTGTPAILTGSSLAQLLAARVALPHGGPNAGVITAPQPDWYGFGLLVYGPTPVMHGHNGHISGFNAANLIVPDRQLSIAILCNIDNIDQDTIIHALEAIASA